MKARLALTITAALVAAAAAAAPAAATGNTVAAVPIPTEQAICADTFGGVYAPPSNEPLAACQWDMALIHADAATRARATGEGIRIGIIDSGVDIDHPDIAPNLDLASSCSFVRSDDPTIVAGLTDPIEAGNGDCANKAAVQDRQRARHPRRLDRRFAGQRDRRRGRGPGGDDRRAEGLHRVDLLLRLRGGRRAAVRG